jgi:tRNA pseudouridine38-40 synthase
MTRWKLIIEYKGTSFSGWQRQENAPSVQQTLEEALFAFCQKNITLHVAGRTDAGVHARAQAAHFDLDYGDRPLGGSDLVKALNAHLRPHPVVIVSAEKTSPEFHARFDARNKLYTYRIICRTAPPVLEEGLVWHRRELFNIPAMQEAARYLLGKHDFSTFRDSQCQAKTPERTLDRLDIEEKIYDAHGGREVLIHAEARSFLHHQVRNITGTLVLVGEGKWTPDDVKAALEARDRTRGGPTAPSEGLYLIQVDYQA